MYVVNDVVEYMGKVGRVLNYTPRTHSIQVLFRTNDYTWTVETCDVLRCVPSETFLWTIELAFRCKHSISHKQSDWMLID